MQLEELSKSQIMLLTLLVSFVTSIATGIVTVSLMEQAPPAIAQTVNRVVERTVERVVPSQAAASAVVTETVIVKESELIAQAVAKAEPSLIRLFVLETDPNGKSSETFLGVGVVVSSDGMLVTDASLLSAPTVTVASASGVRTTARLVSTDNGVDLAFLQAATSSDANISWVPARVRQSGVALGETVVGITGKMTRITTGIVTALPNGENATTTPRIFETNVPTESMAKGSILIDTDGSVVGISTAYARALSESAFLASEEIVYTTEDAEMSAAQ